MQNMSAEQIRDLQVQAKRGELVQKYTKRGIYKDGGESRLLMAPVEDLFSGLMRFIKDGNPEDSVLVEAAFGLVKDHGTKTGSRQSERFYDAFVDGLRYSLGVVGAMSPTNVDINKYKGAGEPLAACQEFGIRLPQHLKENGGINKNSVFDLALAKDAIEENEGDYRLLLHGIKIGLRES